MKVVLSLLFAGIVGVTVWGWMAIESTHRFKASLGVPPSVEGTTGKRMILLSYLIPGTLVFLMSISITSEPLLRWGGVALLGFFLLVEFWTIKRALDKQSADPSD